MYFKIKLYIKIKKLSFKFKKKMKNFPRIPRKTILIVLDYYLILYFNK